MDDFKDISEWLKDAFENHKEFNGYGLYHNLYGFIHEAFKEQKVFVLRYKGKAVAFLTFMPPSEESIRIIFDALQKSSPPFLLCWFQCSPTTRIASRPRLRRQS